MGDHQKWAYEYLESKVKEEELPRLYEAGDALTKEGWVLLHNPSQELQLQQKSKQGLYKSTERVLIRLLYGKKLRERS